MRSLAARLVTERDRASGEVVFVLDGHAVVYCSRDDEYRVKRMLFGRGGLADEVTCVSVGERVT